ncbi:arylesterase [Tepidimonas taiwanensis]|uniref:arylesterase n=1 Tax=Tepidimonas taiwanensis TaxID=307486 RepID=UPI0005BCC7E4
MKRRHCTVALLGAAAGTCLPLRAHATARGSAPVILVVGDSLSAEYGLARGSGWVALLEQRLQRQRPGARVVNASVSGDTTAGGRSRLPALLERHRPDIVILELGGNDALRGLPLATTRDNLRAMIRASRDAGARVLLLGMDMPPNYGERYRAEFRALYTDLAREENTAVVPFFLAGVADRPDAGQHFQDDRIHPNERAQPRLRDNVWAALQRLL